MAGGIFAVQHSPDIGGESPLTIFTQCVAVRLKIIQQGLADGLAVFWQTAGIQKHPAAVYAQLG